MDIDVIIDDYFGNRANKRRSRDSVHFELHWERDLMRLLDDINARSLDPFNDYGKLRSLVEEVSPKWLKYCHYNDDRRCFVANEGYGHNDVLVRKYGFRFNKSKHRHHDKTGNRRQQEHARLANFGS